MGTDVKEVMAAAPHRRGRHLLRGLAALVCGGVVLIGGTTAASAHQKSLSSAVLSHALPGMVANPAGPTNGPLNDSNLSLFDSGNSSKESTFQALLSNGDLQGYVRFWAYHPTNGQVAAILAFRWKNSAELAAFTGAERASEARSGTKFAVSGLPGGSGYLVHSSNGPIYQVIFNQGTTSFLVEVASPKGQLTKADAISLSRQQRANA